MFSSLTSMLGGKLGTKPQRSVAANFPDNAATWEELAAMVASRETELGVTVNRDAADLETGAPSAQAMKRSFGSSEPIRVTLYRDSAAWCPYCQKVWLQLEEKRIPYTIEKINMRCYGDKPPAFLAIVPSGLLPAMRLDGRVVTESSEIMSKLERAFPERPLLPAAGTPERRRADGLMKLERQLFSAWMGWLTSGWGHDQRKKQFITVLGVVEQELSNGGGPFFLGTELSMVDLVYTPFLERMAASLAYYKGFIMRGKGTFPHVERWFAAMEGRPAYLATRSDFYTHCHDLPPQLGGCEMHPDGEPVAAATDGTDGTAWRLPLPPLSTKSLEPYAPGDSPPRDTLEAAAKVVSNHAALARFAARGAGQAGARPVMAPLSDPSAIPDEDAIAHADAALRHVAQALLAGVEASPLASGSAEGPSGSADGAAAVACLAYVRDRVGVPRDMSFPAARQLRAHLNWFIDTTMS